MPTTQDTQGDFYAHCLSARCPGYAQQQVAGVRRETFFTFADLGGDANMPGWERSTVSYVFADDADAPCPSCGGAREVTPSARTEYQNLSGHDPQGLLHIRPGSAPDVAALQARIAELEGAA